MFRASQKTGRSLCSVALVTLALTTTSAIAQEPPDGPPAGRGARGRGGRGSAGTREFLGLGPAPDPAAAKKGEPVYKQNCGACHGENARGAQGPNLVRSVVVLHDENDEAIGALIKSGRPQAGMPAFPQLSAEDIHNVDQYIKLQVELAANRGTYGASYGDLRNKVTGDAAAGQRFFNAHCTQCHSATGDLTHIGSKFQQAAQLQQRFLWPAAPGQDKGTVTTPSGQRVTGTLLKNDDFFVALRDQAGDFYEWPKSQVRLEVDDRLAGHRATLPLYSNADIHNMTAYLVTLK